MARVGNFVIICVWTVLSQFWKEHHSHWNIPRFHLFVLLREPFQNWRWAWSTVRMILTREKPKYTEKNHAKLHFAHHKAMAGTGQQSLLLPYWSGRTRSCRELLVREAIWTRQHAKFGVHEDELQLKQWHMLLVHTVKYLVVICDIRMTWRLHCSQDLGNYLLTLAWPWTKHWLCHKQVLPHGVVSLWHLQNIVLCTSQNFRGRTLLRESHFTFQMPNHSSHSKCLITLHIPNA